ncbi:MAG: hypothetical protein WC378_10490 [Opitutaceae bacterium]
MKIQTGNIGVSVRRQFRRRVPKDCLSASKGHACPHAHGLPGLAKGMPVNHALPVLLLDSRPGKIFAQCVFLRRKYSTENAIIRIS